MDTENEESESQTNHKQGDPESLRIPRKGEHNNEQQEANEGHPDPLDDVQKFAGELWGAIKNGKISPLDVVQAIVSFGLLTVGLSQIAISCSSSHQADQLITAANQIQISADSFSKSAGGINAGVSTAVGKLNDQATQLGKNVTQTGRLATDTEKANDNVVEADRPWMGGSFAISSFASGQKPTWTISFTNSGKRPARVTLMVTRAMPLAGKFPDDPERLYFFDTTPSTNFVVPGQVVSAIESSATTISPEDWKLYATPGITFYIFSKIEYTDPRTNKQYWTHYCLRFVPRMNASTDAMGGFRNCTEYNDAK